MDPVPAPISALPNRSYLYLTTCVATLGGWLIGCDTAVNSGAIGMGISLERIEASWTQRN
jgi:hypothetical protein